MQFNDKTYNWLKTIALVILPALTTFYGVVGSQWGIPDTENVVVTMTAFDALLGALLQLSSSKYKNDVDGYASLTGADELTGHPDMKIVLTKDPKDLANNKELRLKVGRNTPAH